MKDKRQRMAFNWPYGDPQMLAYMISAVAANNYSANPMQHLSSNPMAAVAALHQSSLAMQQQQQQHNQQNPKNDRSNNESNSNSTNIKTPSPNTSNLSSASCSSLSTTTASSASASNMSFNGQTQPHCANSSYDTSSANSANVPIGLASPISLYIPNHAGLANTPTSTYSTQTAQHNPMFKPEMYGYDLNSSLLLRPNAMMVQQPPSFNEYKAQSTGNVSFKSPAFGLATTSSSSNSESINNKTPA
jgi:hypothetical protein